MGGNKSTLFFDRSKHLFAIAVAEQEIGRYTESQNCVDHLIHPLDMTIISGFENKSTGVL